MISLTGYWGSFNGYEPIFKINGLAFEHFLNCEVEGKRGIDRI